MKHIQTIQNPCVKAGANTGCGECQASCQSACKQAAPLPTSPAKKRKSNFFGEDGRAKCPPGVYPTKAGFLFYTGGFLSLIHAFTFQNPISDTTDICCWTWKAEPFIYWMKPHFL
jgi:predicted ribosomally synthesized six-cysteine peptide SCIFF